MEPGEIPTGATFRFFAPGYPALGYADGDTANVLDISGYDRPLDTLATGPSLPVFRPASSAGFPCLEFPAYVGMSDASALRAGVVAASFGLVFRFASASAGWASCVLEGASGSIRLNLPLAGEYSYLVNSQTTGWSATAPGGSAAFGTDWLTVVAVIAAARADSFLLINGTRVDESWNWSGDTATLLSENRTLTLGTSGMGYALNLAEAVVWDRALSAAEGAALAATWAGYVE